jgi:Fe2+ transport system protein FeoA
LSDKGLLPLTALKDGERGIVKTIGGARMHGRGVHRGRGFHKRLLDMGLTPGTIVTVVKSAPFQGPIEILVGNNCNCCKVSSISRSHRNSCKRF